MTQYFDYHFVLSHDIDNLKFNEFQKFADSLQTFKNPKKDLKNTKNVITQVTHYFDYHFVWVTTSTT